MAWLQLTETANNQEIFVNMDHILSIHSHDGHSSLRTVMPRTNGVWVIHVKESPHEIANPSTTKVALSVGSEAPASHKVGHGTRFQVSATVSGGGHGESTYFCRYHPNMTGQIVIKL